MSDGLGGVISSTRFTYNTTSQVQTLTSSYVKVDTKSASSVSSIQVIDSFATSFGCAAFFEYCVTESGGAKRMGQIYATWDSSAATFTDVSSPDLNGSTVDLVWKVQVLGGNLELLSGITSGTWDILVATRIIF